MPSLLEAYRAKDPTLLACFAGEPSDLFTQKPDTRAWNQDLIQDIRDYNASMDHHPEFNGDEAVIITGQQPAIFAGPLYSVYKAITCIKLAAELSEKTNSPVVPVYWVGSEDHDFEEAAAVYYPTRKHTTEKLTMPCPEGFEGQSLHRVPLHETISELINKLVATGPGGEFRDEIDAFLKDATSTSTSLADWSTRILARLFRDTSLIFFAPHLTAARASSASIIQAAIEKPLVTSAVVNEGARKMEELGYTAQVVKNDHECAFFYETDGIRAKVLFENNAYQLAELNRTISKEELLSDLRDGPERFSPNVALRCVVQQHLFPVAAYVAGPGELAYWGQFKGVFEAFNAPMPIVYPRAQAVLTNLKLNKLLKKYGLTPADLAVPKDELLQSCLRSISESPEIEKSNQIHRNIRATLTEFAGELHSNTPTAASMVENLVADLDRKFAKLEKNLLLSDSVRRDTVTGHIQRLQQCLSPGSKPQERMHTIVPYLFEHGWGLLDTLIRELEIGTTTLTEVEL